MSMGQNVCGTSRYGAIFLGASCPWGELSIVGVVLEMSEGRNVHRASCPWATFLGEKYHGMSCHEVSCPWGQVAIGRIVQAHLE